MVQTFPSLRCAVFALAVLLVLTTPVLAQRPRAPSRASRARGRATRGRTTAGGDCERLPGRVCPCLPRRRQPRPLGRGRPVPVAHRVQCLQATGTRRAAQGRARQPPADRRRHPVRCVGGQAGRRAAASSRAGCRAGDRRQGPARATEAHLRQGRHVLGVFADDRLAHRRLVQRAARPVDSRPADWRSHQLPPERRTARAVVVAMARAADPGWPLLGRGAVAARRCRGR